MADIQTFTPHGSAFPADAPRPVISGGRSPQGRLLAFSMQDKIILVDASAGQQPEQDTSGND